MQSREYEKKISETETVKKIAYEVSISKMERASKDSSGDEEDTDTADEENIVEEIKD